MKEESCWDLDLSTAYGRGMAGMLGEVDTMEVEIKGERTEAAQRSRSASLRAELPRSLLLHRSARARLRLRPQRPLPRSAWERGGRTDRSALA